MISFNSLFGNVGCSYLVFIYMSGLFGRAPAPAPPAALVGALPNTLEVERLHTVACEKVEQQLCHEKVAPVEPQKTAPPAPAPAPPFLQGAGALPNRHSIFHTNYQQRGLLVKII